jgi:hypothetical protein
MSKPKFPFGAADAQSKAYAATIAATITDAKTFLTLGQLTGAATLNLTVDPQLEAGAELLIKTSVDGTNRVLTPGTGMTGTAQTLTANKSQLLVYVYDGTAFLHAGTTQLN